MSGSPPLAMMMCKEASEYEQQSDHAPSEKEQKYDRQLRLWASSGQQALESAHLVLFNSLSGIVAIETLKNIVLPGIGRFTILDEGLITEADLGGNFFVDKTALGMPRAQRCVELLLELNSDVQGDWEPKDNGPLNIDSVLNRLPSITILLYTFPIRKEDEASLKAFGFEHNIPIISIHSVGFYSYFHIDLPTFFPVVETHPEVSAELDLRLLDPWSKLSAFAAQLTQDIDALDDHKHGHLPWAVIILHYLNEWKKCHGDSPPSSAREKAAFRKTIERAMRRDVPGGPEENFEEALSFLRRVLTPPCLPDALCEIFQLTLSHADGEGLQGQKADLFYDKPKFWTICRAIMKFHDKHNCLPVPGNVPDMKAESDVYLKLQRIYKDKAREDADKVYEYARGLGYDVSVSQAEVDLFCRNAAFIKLIRPSHRTAKNMSELLVKILAADDEMQKCGMPPSLLPSYLALKAASYELDPPTPETLLNNIIDVVPSAQKNASVISAACEVARAQGGELHNISAVTGGLVAQEVIKIATRQYVPIDNTCIYDGITSRCQVFRL